MKKNNGFEEFHCKMRVFLSILDNETFFIFADLFNKLLVNQKKPK